MLRGHRWAQSQLSGKRTMTPIKKRRFNSWKKSKYAVTSAQVSSFDVQIFLTYMLQRVKKNTHGFPTLVAEKLN